MNEYRLESFIQLHEGAITVPDTALPASDNAILREAQRTGAFVQARTNMSVGYAVIGVSSTHHTRASDEQEGHTFSLMYSGESEDSNSA